MTSIIGIISKDCDAGELVRTGLSNLTYRGLEGCSVAEISDMGSEKRLAVNRTLGLPDKLQKPDYPSDVAIGQNYWSGEENCVIERIPSLTVDDIAVVQLWTIDSQTFENFKTSRIEMLLPHELARLIKAGYNPNEAITKVIGQTRGEVALIAFDLKNPDILFGGSGNSRLFIGCTPRCHFITSDLNAVWETEPPEIRYKVIAPYDNFEISYDAINCIDHDTGKPIERDFEILPNYPYK